MNRKMLIILLMFLQFLTGCSMLEIEDYSIVAGIGIDYVNDEFVVTYEVYEENNGQTTNLTSVVKIGNGKTISEAINKISSHMNKKPYLNHASIIIINDGVVKQKFDETINYLLHDVRVRSACILMISENQTAKEIFAKSEEKKRVISYEIYKHFDIKEGIIEKWSNSKFNEVINEKLDTNGTIIIPTVEYENDFDINGAYLIKSDNSYISIDQSEVFVLQIFNNCIAEGLFNVKGLTSYYIKKMKSKLNYNKTNNTINLVVDMEINSYEKIEKKKEEEYILQVSKELENYING